MAALRLSQDHQTTSSTQVQNTAEHALDRARKAASEPGTFRKARVADVFLFEEASVCQELGPHDAGSLDDVTCPHCQAYRWAGELSGQCCGHGDIRVMAVTAPPDEMFRYLDDKREGKKFLDVSRRYNNALALASMGTDRFVGSPDESNFAPCIKIQVGLCVWHILASS
jgi:hypothetical protein